MTNLKQPTQPILKRADLCLVDLGFAKSRSQAQLLIKEGCVYFKAKRVEKASMLVNSLELEIRGEASHYVGRGWQKLAGALESFKIDPCGCITADIGASTGGFTQVLLEKGAKKVYALDVGHDQLASELKTDSRVVNMEGINIRYFEGFPEKIDLAVADLSYISLTLVLNSIFNLLSDKGQLVVLVKPQFEVGPERIGKKGVVKSLSDQLFALKKVYDWCLEHNYIPTQVLISPIFGKTGNREFFYNIKSSKYENEKLTFEAIEKIVGESV